MMIYRLDITFQERVYSRTVIKSHFSTAVKKTKRMGFLRMASQKEASLY